MHIGMSNTYFCCTPRIVPQKQATFSVSMSQNWVSRAKTAIVTEKPADSSVTMTQNADYIRNTTPAQPLSHRGSTLRSTLRQYAYGHGRHRESKRNHIHVHSLDVPLRQLELMNQRMSKERTPLIRLHENSFTVEVDAVRVGLLTRYDFFECHYFLNL